MFDHFLIIQQTIQNNFSAFTVQKMKFSIKNFFSISFLVTFTEEILNEKRHFLCSD